MKEMLDILIKNIEVDNDQPRKTFEDINDLAKSILNQGLLEPLKVIRLTPNSYRLLDGERRYLALEKLSKKDPKYLVASCIVVQPKQNKLITQLSFDVQKNKIPLLEEAEAYKKLIKDGAYTVKELAYLMGKNSSYIKGRLKISSLSDKTKEYIKTGRMNAGALTLVDIDSLRKAEETIVERIIEEDPKRYSDYQKIIVEETQKVDSMIELFANDLIKFKNRVLDFERRSNNIEIPKIRSLLGSNLIEANRIIKDFIKGFNKIENLKEQAIETEKELYRLQLKYGKGVEIKELMFKESGE